MDEHGYITEKELEQIKKWDVAKDANGLIRFLEDNWYFADQGYFKYEYPSLELHTAGWSGNEDTIHALEQNTTFWMLCWVMSKRGGHYYFDVSLVI